MAQCKSYKIVIYDPEEDQHTEYLPIHIKAKNHALHEKITEFVTSMDNDKNTYVFDGYGGYIKVNTKQNGE
jgi:hypothetical protein